MPKDKTMNHMWEITAEINGEKTTFKTPSTVYPDKITCQRVFSGRYEGFKIINIKAGVKI